MSAKAQVDLGPVDGAHAEFLEDIGRRLRSGGVRLRIRTEFFRSFGFVGLPLERDA